MEAAVNDTREKTDDPNLDARLEARRTRLFNWLSGRTQDQELDVLLGKIIADQWLEELGKKKRSKKRHKATR
jgi:hypothetical protein